MILGDPLERGTKAWLGIDSMRKGSSAIGIHWSAGHGPAMCLGIPECQHPWVFSLEVVFSREHSPSHLLPGGHWLGWWSEGVERGSSWGSSEGTFPWYRFSQCISFPSPSPDPHVPTSRSFLTEFLQGANLPARLGTMQPFGCTGWRRSGGPRAL